MDCSRLRPLVCLACAYLALAGCHHLPKYDENAYQTKISMAKLLVDQGQADKAATLYHELEKLNPKDAGPPHELALIEAKKGHTQLAEEYFREAHKRAPKDVDLLNDFGYWLYLNDRLEEAETYLAEALEIDPERKTVLTNLATVVGKRGRFEESFRIFLRGSNSEADAHCSIAYIYAQLRQFDEAKRHFEKALELEPNLKPAAEALVQLNRRDADPAFTPAESTGTPAGQARQ